MDLITVIIAEMRECRAAYRTNTRISAFSNASKTRFRQTYLQSTHKYIFRS